MQEQSPQPIQTFSSIDFVGQCLTDRERTEAFEHAVNEKVKPGMQVLDMGTGFCILALFAARAGGTVTALEYDPHIAKIARDIVAKNQYPDRVRVVEGDVRAYDFQGKIFDVVIAEMLTTGIVDEYQVQAINNLHRQRAVTEKTQYIPEAQETYLALGYHEYDRHGFSLPFVKHLWRWQKQDPHAAHFDLMSDNVLLGKVCFSEVNPETFSATITILATKRGTVNALRLSSKTVLGKGNILGDTDAINAPMAIPITPRPVQVGQVLTATIHYLFGGGYSNFSAEVQ